MGMRLFDRTRVLSNMWIATRHLSPDRPGPIFTNLKTSFHQALRGVQNIRLKTVEHDVYVDFNNDDIVVLLIRNELLTRDYVAHRHHLVRPSMCRHYRSKIQAALNLIDDLDSRLSSLIRMLISTVACYRIPDTEGGTISSCVGLIYVSPDPDWSPEIYAELLVHEFLHNSLFLEDMVRGVFPDYGLFEDPDALAISTLRRTKRPYDKSYHSACVAVGLMYLNHLMSRADKEGDLHLRLTDTLKELEACEQRMRAAGKIIVSENGRTLMNEIGAFLSTRDYGGLANALQS
jgi:HEXXH motif-containing protein